jgi:hypothetical protein
VPVSGRPTRDGAVLPGQGRCFDYALAVRRFESGRHVTRVRGASPVRTAQLALSRVPLGIPPLNGRFARWRDPESAVPAVHPGMVAEMAATAGTCPQRIVWNPAAVEGGARMRWCSKRRRAQRVSLGSTSRPKTSIHSDWLRPTLCR